MTPPEAPLPLRGSGEGHQVTEADVLTNIIEYGERCRDMEARLRAWIALAESWQQDASPQQQGQSPQSGAARPEKALTAKDEK